MSKVIDNINRVARIDGIEAELGTVSNRIDESLGNVKTPLPTVNVVGSVNENSHTVMTYTAESGVNVSIVAEKGGISGLGNGQFTYIAPEISNGVNTTDRLTITATRVGELRNGTEVELNVIYVPMVEDDALSNANFRVNKMYSNGFTY